MEASPVTIAVRERPVNDNTYSSIYYHPNTNVLVVGERPFSFDHILRPSTQQEELYIELIKPLVEKFEKGFNSIVLAYGQTGTGKSYTMGLNSNSFEGQHVGIVPRCLREIIQKQEATSTTIGEIDTKREISASFIEIYNEKVYDLLAANYTEARSFTFTGGTRKQLNIENCFEILKQGNKNRHVRPTVMNSQSSRSHAVFTIHLHQQNGTKITKSSLHLVDLAGAEGVRRTRHEGVARSEGVHINCGLLAISKVLTAMTEGRNHIPYRESLVTSVLRDSLNLKSYITLLACVSPCREDVNETLFTLQFAQDAKQLKTTPQLNTILAEYKKNNNRTETPYTFKRPRTTVAQYAEQRSKSSQKKQTHSNTYSTPAKIPHMEKNKLNRTDDSSATKMNPQGACSQLLLREMNSTSSSSQLNLTAINGSANKYQSFSPVMRMLTHIQNEITTLKSSSIAMHRNNQKQTANITSDSILSSDTSLPSQNVRMQLFKTSSPILKEANLLGDSMGNVKEACDDQVCELPLFADTSKIEPNKAVRRSTRIANKLNITNITNCSLVHNSIYSSSRKRRSFTSLKSERKPKRRNSKLDSTVIEHLTGQKKTTKKNLAQHKKNFLEFLNTGTVKELQVLPKIGPKTAFKIVLHRSLNGKFKTLEKLAELEIFTEGAWLRFVKANMLE